MIYLMGLKKQCFGDPAAIAWRMVFVHILFPWIKKYRVLSNDRYHQAVANLSRRQAEQIEEKKGFLVRTEENIGHYVEMTTTVAAGTTGFAGKATEATFETILATGTKATTATGVFVHKLADAVSSPPGKKE